MRRGNGPEITIPLGEDAQGAVAPSSGPGIMTDVITTVDLVVVLRHFRSGLERHESTINRLNVYPVPDGDTGTNMLLTVDAAVRAIDAVDSDDGALLPALIRGSLLGARGNSGVILSQILRACAEAFTEGPIGSLEYAAMLTRASDAAYDAVLRPVEGTVLTVARCAAESATASVGSLTDAATAARGRAQATLEHTPDLLAVLREAGVVDAGGAGLVQLYAAFEAVITGTPMAETLVLPREVEALLNSRVDLRAPLPTASGTDTSGGSWSEQGAPHVESVGGARYEVMFLLQTGQGAIDHFKQRWAEIGESIVVVGGDGLFNCHIHTGDIGAAIDAAVAVGRPLEIRVTDLFEQVGALEAHPHPAGSAPDKHDGYRNPATTAVVAVASGEGIVAILRSLGVAEIVSGGQSMNPSTEEILAGIGSAVSREVVVLPNNSNIIPVAREAAKLAGRAVVVVPTSSIQAGIAALIAYDPAADAAENATRMNAAISGVVCGEVTRAVRDALTPSGAVSAGSWIGLSNEGIVATGLGCADAAAALVEALLTPDHEMLTVIEGVDAPSGEIESLLAIVTERHPRLVVEHHVGDQPVYPVLLSLE